ncbi:MAG: hypothetical protein ACREV5_00370 [Steroidobacter sp.]
MRSRVSLIALAVAAALPSLASAVDFSYSGFSTAAYAQTDTDEAAVGYVGQPEGIDSDGSFAIDSKLGLQVSAKFNDFVSATVQGVAYADLTSDWAPHLDWAYVRVQPLANLSARAGYLRAPTFMFSDSVFIGYANTWVRPPLEVYNLSPVYQLRGADLTWRETLGPVTVSINPYYGEGKTQVGEAEDDVEAKNWGGLVVSGEYDSFAARIGYSESELELAIPSIDALAGALNSIPAAFCPGCASVAEQIDFRDVGIVTLNVGAQYDDGSNVLIAEFARRRTESYIVPDMHSAYATYGRRFGGLTPYATVAMTRRDDVEQTNAIPAVGPLAALAAGVNMILASGNNDQNSYSLGVRYDVPSFSVLKAALVKLQFDHIDTRDGVGMMNSVQPGFDGDVNMISASFDFIF